jgi:sporulation protein YlmC with PRC-barrel domain
MSYVERDAHGMYRASSMAGPDTRHGPGAELLAAGTLVGRGVYNGQGEDLGDVTEVMLDLRTGRVAYAVLSVGGFLGFGGKLFAVPWAALTLDPENRHFALDVGRERLSRAPGFDREKWPDMADVAWAKGIHAYYGTEPDEDRLTL